MKISRDIRSHLPTPEALARHLEAMRAAVETLAAPPAAPPVPPTPPQAVTGPNAADPSILPFPGR